MRYRTLLFTVPGLTVILSLSACGSEQATGTASKTSQARPGSGVTTATPAAESRLNVEFRASDQASPKRWTLTCDPAGGDHPQAAAACAALAKTPDPFKPTPKDQMCTDIYGGPQVAKVTGTWQGKPVNTEFTRKNGCELSRWTKLAPLFVTTG